MFVMRTSPRCKSAASSPRLGGVTPGHTGDSRDLPKPLTEDEKAAAHAKVSFLQWVLDPSPNTLPELDVLDSGTSWHDTGGMSYEQAHIRLTADPEEVDWLQRLDQQEVQMNGFQDFQHSKDKKCTAPRIYLAQRLLKAGVPFAVTDRLSELAAKLFGNQVLTEGIKAMEERSAADAAFRAAVEQAAADERARMQASMMASGEQGA
ncbi:hypothetical protein HaLaN_21147 [Haematococcus lacustris]|uniref:Uncharacterized protein n=1 Tax=Haematococcus lacustris TaxID=44745 RepID=A0A699ZXV2_HAELA|nr:hypothetical protein HaLaN_21147 [Haematococcus lacustris]